LPILYFTVRSRHETTDRGHQLQQNRRLPWCVECCDARTLDHDRTYVTKALRERRACRFKRRVGSQQGPRVRSDCSRSVASGTRSPQGPSAARQSTGRGCKRRRTGRIAQSRKTASPKIPNGRRRSRPNASEGAASLACPRPLLLRSTAASRPPSNNPFASDQ